MSRPALPPDQSASAIVRLRVLPRQKSAWVRAARRAGQTLSAWLCRLADAQSARPEGKADEAAAATSAKINAGADH